MHLMVERSHKDHIVAAPGFNRWLAPLASIAIHLYIGSIYAWSLFSPPLTKTLGVVAPAAGDWSLTEVVWIFSVAIVVSAGQFDFRRPPVTGIDRTVAG